MWFLILAGEKLTIYFILISHTHTHTHTQWNGLILNQVTEVFSWMQIRCSSWLESFFHLWLCSGRAVQASSSHGPWVPPPPSLQSDAACQRLAGAARCGIKDSACPVSVPCVEKCWSTPPSPPSLHAEKCVTLPLVIKRPVLQSAGTHASYKKTCAAKCER